MIPKEKKKREKKGKKQRWKTFTPLLFWTTVCVSVEACVDCLPCAAGSEAKDPGAENCTECEPGRTPQFY